MTANELETRTLAAEADPSLIRQLITDFKAAKDAQLSDLTAQVNTSNAAVTEAEAAQKKAEDEATKATADKATADADLAEATASRDKAVAELAAMTAQDQQHAAAVVTALDWTAIDAEYSDLQSKLAANSAKYDAARATLKTLAAAINAPFAERETAAKAARAADLKAQLDALK